MVSSDLLPLGMSHACKNARKACQPECCREACCEFCNSHDLFPVSVEFNVLSCFLRRSASQASYREIVEDRLMLFNARSLWV